MGVTRVHNINKGLSVSNHFNDIKAWINVHDYCKVITNISNLKVAFSFLHLHILHSVGVFPHHQMLTISSPDTIDLDKRTVPRYIKSSTVKVRFGFQSLTIEEQRLLSTPTVLY